MIRAARNLARLFTIARTLARYDALFLMEKLPVARNAAFLARLVSRRNVPGRPGERLADALEALGPSFIKLGQALSIRPDLVGDDVADDLTGLQDRLPPFSSSEARRIIADEMEKPVEALYDAFDDQPVAAASIAQVHYAVTTAGHPVAVKVLRPNAESAIHRDLDLMYWVAGLIEHFAPAFRRLKPVETVRTFERSVTMEMDLRFEAAAAQEMQENFLENPEFRVPDVDWQRTSQRVLTTERISGIPIDEAEQLREAGHDPQVVVRNAAAVFFAMVFRDGFFHADMHPGNLFVGPDGTLLAVDFGIMGRLDSRTRHYLADMLIGFLQRDYRRVAEVHFKAGFVPADRSVDAFTQACRSIAEPVLGKPLAEISIARLLGHLFHVTETFGMEVQPHLLLLQKSMLLTEGVGRRLDPNVNMWELARPLIEDWIAHNMGPMARMRETASETRDSLERLPRLAAKLEDTTDRLNQGVPLHPDSVRALTHRRTPMTVKLLWAAVAVLAVLVAFEV